jgi:hypothetical protein
LNSIQLHVANKIEIVSIRSTHNPRPGVACAGTDDKVVLGRDPSGRIAG